MSKGKGKKLKAELIKDINNVLTELRKMYYIRDELGISAKDISGKGFVISFEGKSDINNIMYDIHLPVSSIMDELLRERQYTVLLYDRSIIQVEFTIKNGEIVKERLLFLKKHNKIWDKEEIRMSDAADEDWFADEDGIPVFLRVDYDPKSHIECDHAATHLTISNYETCRIPIQNVVSFSEFVRFVLFHFYGRKLEMPIFRIDKNNTITELERKMIHLGWI